MGQTNRLVFKMDRGEHKDHIMIANRRDGNNCGRHIRTTIIRCYTCFKVGKNSIQVEQDEIRRDTV